MSIKQVNNSRERSSHEYLIFSGQKRPDGRVIKRVESGVTYEYPDTLSADYIKWRKRKKSFGGDISFTEFYNSLSDEQQKDIAVY